MKRTFSLADARITGAFSLLSREHRWALINYVDSCVDGWKRPMVGEARVATGLVTTRAVLDTLTRAVIRERALRLVKVEL